MRVIWMMAFFVLAFSSTARAACGIPVEVNYNVGTTGLATLYYGRPIIFINPNLLPPTRYAREDTIEFIIEHECQHHLLGHIEAYLQGRSDTYSFELQADLVAARALCRRRDYRALQAGMAVYSALGSASGYPGSPSGDDHLAAVQEGAAQAGC